MALLLFGFIKIVLDVCWLGWFGWFGCGTYCVYFDMFMFGCTLCCELLFTCFVFLFVWLMLLVFVAGWFSLCCFCLLIWFAIGFGCELNDGFTLVLFCDLVALRCWVWFWIVVVLVWFTCLYCLFWVDLFFVCLIVLIYCVSYDFSGFGVGIAGRVLLCCLLAILFVILLRISCIYLLVFVLLFATYDI